MRRRRSRGQHAARQHPTSARAVRSCDRPHRRALDRLARVLAPHAYGTRAIEDRASLIGGRAAEPLAKTPTTVTAPVSVRVSVTSSVSRIRAIGRLPARGVPARLDPLQPPPRTLELPPERAYVR